VLPDAKQSSAEPTKRRSLSSQTVDFHAYRCRQRRIGCAPAKLAKLMFEVLLGLRRDIPASPLPLKFGDELSSDAHVPMIAELAAPVANIQRT
jgi:hypothetical protein